MKRFYEKAGTAAADGGFAILLDGRAVKTPARAALIAPTRALAEAIVAEWAAQGEAIDPRSMPLTGLANAAIDRVRPDPASFARDIAVYGESDLLCYRADAPAGLVARQAEAWDPLLEWARARFDVTFEVTAGIVHRAQPAATIARLAGTVATRDPYALAALHPLTTIGGSLVAALAVAEGTIGADDAFAITHLDELWQAERWGEDMLALAARDARRRDFTAAATFLALAE